MADEPWKKYQQGSSDGPWKKYGTPVEPTAPTEGGAMDMGVGTKEVMSSLQPPRDDLLARVQRGLGNFSGAMKLGAGYAMKPFEMLDRAAYDVGGKVTDIAATHMPAEAAAAVGTAANLGVQQIPTLVGGAITKAAASPVLNDWAHRLMQSALKPSAASQRTGQAAEAINTMLEKGISVTPGGIAKLRSQIDDLNNSISHAIATSNETVNKREVARVLRETVDKFKMQVNPQSDLTQIRNAWVDFLNHPLFAGKADIPVQAAQELKQGTYRALGSKAYGELKGVDLEAQKALARGLKDQIAQKVPGVGQLNKAESELLNAETLAVSRVMMDRNKDIVGLPWLAKNPAAWLAYAADRSPFIKSILARGLYAGKDVVPETAGRAVGATLGAYSGRAED